jgi:hypothetical protein
MLLIPWVLQLRTLPCASAAGQAKVGVASRGFPAVYSAGGGLLYGVACMYEHSI